MKKLKHFRSLIASVARGSNREQVFIRYTKSKYQEPGRINPLVGVSNDLLSSYTKDNFHYLGWTIYNNSFRFHKSADSSFFVLWYNDKDLSEDKEFNDHLLASEAEWEAEQLERLLSKQEEKPRKSSRL